jgi:hypothetical protein
MGKKTNSKQQKKVKNQAKAKKKKPAKQLVGRKANLH